MRQTADTRDLRNIADQLDSKFVLPGGFKIGWDGILGLIPGVGDILTNGLSFYILYRGAMIGCPPSVIARMGINVLIDNLLDAIPFIGNIFDFFYKSNLKNLMLIEQYTADPARTTNSSRAVVAFSLFLVAAVVVLSIALTVFVAVWVFNLLTGADFNTISV